MRWEERRGNTYYYIVAEEWERTPAIRPDVELDAFVVMPDHMHDIIVIAERDAAAPAPDPAALRSPARSIGAIVRGFKGAVVRRVGAPIWQRNYYEHIIRSEADLERSAPIDFGHTLAARWLRWGAPLPESLALDNVMCGADYGLARFDPHLQQDRHEYLPEPLEGFARLPDICDL